MMSSTTLDDLANTFMHRVAIDLLEYRKLTNPEEFKNKQVSTITNSVISMLSTITQGLIANLNPFDKTNNRRKITRILTRRLKKMQDDRSDKIDVYDNELLFQYETCYKLIEKVSNRTSKLETIMSKTMLSMASVRDGLDATKPFELRIRSSQKSLNPDEQITKLRSAAPKTFMHRVALDILTYCRLIHPEKFNDSKPLTTTADIINELLSVTSNMIVGSTVFDRSDNRNKIVGILTSVLKKMKDDILSGNEIYDDDLLLQYETCYDLIEMGTTNFSKLDGIMAKTIADIISVRDRLDPGMSFDFELKLRNSQRTIVASTAHLATSSSMTSSTISGEQSDHPSAGSTSHSVTSSFLTSSVIFSEQTEYPFAKFIEDICFKNSFENGFFFKIYLMYKNAERIEEKYKQLQLTSDPSQHKSEDILPGVSFNFLDILVGPGVGAAVDAATKLALKTIEQIQLSRRRKLAENAARIKGIARSYGELERIITNVLPSIKNEFKDWVSKHPHIKEIKDFAAFLAEEALLYCVENEITAELFSPEKIPVAFRNGIRDLMLSVSWIFSGYLQRRKFKSDIKLMGFVVPSQEKGDQYFINAAAIDGEKYFESYFIPILTVEQSMGFRPLSNRETLLYDFHQIALKAIYDCAEPVIQGDIATKPATLDSGKEKYLIKGLRELIRTCQILIEGGSLMPTTEILSAIKTVLTEVMRPYFFHKTGNPPEHVSIRDDLLVEVPKDWRHPLEQPYVISDKAGKDIYAALELLKDQLTPGSENTSESDECYSLSPMRDQNVISVSTPASSSPGAPILHGLSASEVHHRRRHHREIAVSVDSALGQPVSSSAVNVQSESRKRKRFS